MSQVEQPSEVQSSGDWYLDAIRKIAELGRLDEFIKLSKDLKHQTEQELLRNQELARKGESA